MSIWNRKDFLLQFIEEYRTLPALWRTKSKEYGNRLQKELAYSELVEFSKNFDPSADKQSVINKINNLRSAFRKEIKKVEASRQAGDVSVYESKLWYFPHLLFVVDQEDPGAAGQSNSDLGNGSYSFNVKNENPGSPVLSDFSGERNDDFTPIEAVSQSPSRSQVSTRIPSPAPSHSQRPSKGSLHSHSQDPSPGPSHCQSPSPGLSYSPGSSPEQSNYQDHFLVEIPSQTSLDDTPHEFSRKSAPKYLTAKRPKKRKCEDEEILDAARARLLNPIVPPPLDENESFGKTIGLLLRKTSKEQQIYARKLMYEVISEAELGNLSRASYFVASPQLSAAIRSESAQKYHSHPNTQ